MTKKIWEFSEGKVLEENRIKLFLVLNIVIWCMIGAVAWMAISRIVMKDILWLFLFSGYAGVFLGLIGGIVYVMNHTRY